MFRASPPSDSATNDQQSDMRSDSSVVVHPVVGAAWRGRFSIPCLNLDINVAAHVSNKACLKVSEVASTMPKSLCLEMIPRIDTWPASFKGSPPTEHSIALFFFSKGRDEEVLDNLVTHAICTDFALKSMIGEAELLIFTSLQLPQNLHRLQGKPYFWGVFRGQQGAVSPQTEYNVHGQTIRARKSLSPNSGYPKSFNLKGSPDSFPSKNSPLTQVSKADRRGRRLDDAWQHAKPLDLLRQKAECRYCGFVSSHGGISRLKAHLGGGNPGTRLPGCDNVSPEVKKVMAEWFSEWVKKTKALWTKDIRAESAGYVDKRGMTRDATQGHDKPLDTVPFEQTDCKYFGGESLPGGILHRKVHLGGGSKMHQEDWYKVSPEIKGSMSDWVKNLTASKMKKSKAGEQPERRGRPLDDAWGHAKALDDARQKTRCNHCGFVSTYGGISRLKAHLGGGSPQMQLQGCPQVPLEVKRVMEQWFSEWSKNSAAAWTRNSNATPARPSKRSKPDDAWEHAIPLDETGEASRCKYCGFVSKCGGIARLKAHLSGGDRMMQVECCPNVSPEIRNLMATGKKKHRKKSKGVPLDTFEGVLQGIPRTSSEAQWSDKQRFVLQETLDEISNTSVKGRLKRLIEAKNANVQEMQFEVSSLQMQLASIP
ncbi:uncharacterized protein LOC131011728 isoform X3 [Salvia miltiorrhiza]|uniref:uncharacterized protein LOC131011728 isoform X3 n=1 Tax=Salvia miltiorrhiza TaxID=226208 RepID=UPI0025ACC0C1|nr:uncharacterized protein LOC131011728 isoform X3 [Salvia miltiorrhiza]